MIISYDIPEESVEQVYNSLKKIDRAHLWFSYNKKKFSFYYKQGEKNYNNIKLSLRSGKSTTQDDVMMARLIVNQAFIKLKKYENF